MKKIFCVITAICFLFSNFAFASDIQHLNPTPREYNLQTPMASDDISYGIPGISKKAVLARMFWLASLKTVNQGTDRVDGETDASQLRAVFGGQPNLFFTENTVLAHNPAAVEIFYKRIEKLGTREDGHIFSVPSCVTKNDKPDNYVLVFSTVPDADGGYPITFYTTEEFAQRKPEIEHWADRDNILMRSREEENAADIYADHEEVSDPFWGKRIMDPESHVVLSGNELEAFLFGSPAPVNLDMILRQSGVSEVSILDITREVSRKELVIVRADFRELPTVKMRDGTTRRGVRNIVQHSHASQRKIWVAIGDKGWSKFLKLYGALRSDQLTQEMIDQAQSVCREIGERILYEVGALCGLNGEVFFNPQTKRYESANSLSMISMIAKLQGDEKLEAQGRLEALKEEVAGIKPVDLDYISGINAIGQVYTRDVAYGKDRRKQGKSRYVAQNKYQQKRRRQAIKNREKREKRKGGRSTDMSGRIPDVEQGITEEKIMAVIAIMGEDSFTLQGLIEAIERVNISHPHLNIGELPKFPGRDVVLPMLSTLIAKGMLVSGREKVTAIARLKRFQVPLTGDLVSTLANAVGETILGRWMYVEVDSSEGLPVEFSAWRRRYTLTKKGKEHARTCLEELSGGADKRKSTDMAHQVGGFKFGRSGETRSDLTKEDILLVIAASEHIPGAHLTDRIFTLNELKKIYHAARQAYPILGLPSLHRGWRDELISLVNDLSPGKLIVITKKRQPPTIRVNRRSPCVQDLPALGMLIHALQGSIGDLRSYIQAQQQGREEDPPFADRTRVEEIRIIKDQIRAAQFGQTGPTMTRFLSTITSAALLRRLQARTASTESILPGYLTMIGTRAHLIDAAKGEEAGGTRRSTDMSSPVPDQEFLSEREKVLRSILLSNLWKTSFDVFVAYRGYSSMVAIFQRPRTERHMTRNEIADLMVENPHSLVQSGILSAVGKNRFTLSSAYIESTEFHLLAMWALGQAFSETTWIEDILNSALSKTDKEDLIAERNRLEESESKVRAKVSQRIEKLVTDALATTGKSMPFRADTPLREGNIFVVETTGGMPETIYIVIDLEGEGVKAVMISDGRIEVSGELITREDLTAEGAQLIDINKEDAEDALELMEDVQKVYAAKVDLIRKAEETLKAPPATGADRRRATDMAFTQIKGIPTSATRAILKEQILKGSMDIENWSYLKIKDRNRYIECLPRLAEVAALSTNIELKRAAQYIILKTSNYMGAQLSCVRNLYRHKADMEHTLGRRFTIPAINIRCAAFDEARIAFETAMKMKVGAFQFEIAPTEVKYTGQDLHEYATMIVAAAMHCGYTGPVFLKLDHMRLDAKAYAQDAEKEIQRIFGIMKEAIDAGFYAIDIDASTLEKNPEEVQDPVEQQRDNFEVSARLVEMARQYAIEQDVELALGVEIGEIGAAKITKHHIEAFLSNLRNVLELRSRQLEWKIDMPEVLAIPSGSPHAGFRHPVTNEVVQGVDNVKIAFGLLEEAYHLCSQYGMIGPVQHGASTLPLELFDMFAPTGVTEIHLATAISDIEIDMVLEEPGRSLFYRDFRLGPLGQGVQAKRADRELPPFSDEALQRDKERRKLIGGYKAHFWNPDMADRALRYELLSALFAKWFRYLGLVDTEPLVKRVYPRRTRLAINLVEGKRAIIDNNAELTLLKKQGGKARFRFFGPPDCIFYRGEAWRDPVKREGITDKGLQMSSPGSFEFTRHRGQVGEHRHEIVLRRGENVVKIYVTFTKSSNQVHLTIDAPETIPIRRAGEVGRSTDMSAGVPDRERANPESLDLLLSIAFAGIAQPNVLDGINERTAGQVYQYTREQASELRLLEERTGHRTAFLRTSIDELCTRGLLIKSGGKLYVPENLRSEVIMLGRVIHCITRAYRAYRDEYLPRLRQAGYTELAEEPDDALDDTDRRWMADLSQEVFGDINRELNQSLLGISNVELLLRLYDLLVRSGRDTLNYAAKVNARLQQLREEASERRPEGVRKRPATDMSQAVPDREDLSEEAREFVRDSQKALPNDYQVGGTSYDRLRSALDKVGLPRFRSIESKDVFSFLIDFFRFALTGDSSEVHDVEICTEADAAREQFSGVDDELRGLIRKAVVLNLKNPGVPVADVSHTIKMALVETDPGQIGNRRSVLVESIPKSPQPETKRERRVLKQTEGLSPVWQESCMIQDLKLLAGNIAFPLTTNMPNWVANTINRNIVGYSTFREKSLLIFSEKVTFEHGLGAMLPSLAQSGIRVAVVAPHKKERQIIDELNQGKGEDHRIIYGDSVVQIVASVTGERNCYYYKVKGDPLVDMRSVITHDITHMVEEIIKALGEAFGIVESETEKFRRARAFLQAAV